MNWSRVSLVIGSGCGVDGFFFICGRGEWIFELTGIAFFCYREMEAQWHGVLSFMVAASPLLLLRRPPSRLCNETCRCGR